MYNEVELAAEVSSGAVDSDELATLEFFVDR
jgi:hypothetical protein